jgi:hypothetical protein
VRRSPSSPGISTTYYTFLEQGRDHAAAAEIELSQPDLQHLEEVAPRVASEPAVTDLVNRLDPHPNAARGPARPAPDVTATVDR